ncbi:MAG: NAD-dependent epimerase/dehydratase family protein [Thermoleophilaceae bacterium]
MADRVAFVTGASGFIGGRLTERLRADGWRVRALTRSDASAKAVSERGAEPVPGELGDPASIRGAATGCGVAFHAAARVGDGGALADFERDNVEGTRNVLAACAEAGVARFVHVGTEAALLAGEPLVAVDESAPLRPDSPAPYAATKARAELAVRRASRAGFETVVVRPRLVWGVGDTTVLPAIVDAVRRGRFRWIGGGGHLTSTTHIDNAVEGLLLAATLGTPGSAYFVTDGQPVIFREFVTDLLATQGITAPDRSLPAPLATAIAVAGETLWRLLRLGGAPPLTRMSLWVSSLETTLDDSRARSELGYRPVRTVAGGLKELRDARPRSELADRSQP